MDIENIEICPHEIVKILNIMLAVEPETVLALIKNRPVVQTQELKDFLNMTGSRLSFIGVLNFFLKEKGSKYLIGAECDLDDKTKEITFVKFFHIIERN